MRWGANKAEQPFLKLEAALQSPLAPLSYFPGVHPGGTPAMTDLQSGHTAAPRKTAAERFGVLPRPDLTFTPEVASETAHLYERVKGTIPEIEWPVYAPYVAAINRIKKQRGAVILAHNYQTPDIYHCVADIVGALHGRNVKAPQPAKDGADPRHAGRLFAC
jgi:Quinolinate synthetase A protein